MKVSEIKIGETYNQIQIISDLGYHKPDHRYGCRCALCGKEFEISAKHIGKVKTCRECYEKSEIVDISGQRFGRLVALERVGRTLAPNGTRQSMWRCRCDCGNETVVKYIALKSGNTKSCGCGEIENRYSCNMNKRKSASSIFYISDLEKHPLRKIWKSMLMRCNNPHVKNYNNYGGRGIKVCDRWNGNLGFENFVNDMGERPDGTTLDRIDVNGNYEPSNCRWATTEQQMNNRTDNSRIILNGESITCSQLCKRYGFYYTYVAHQLRQEIDVNAIITRQLRDKSIRRGKRGELQKHINHNRIVSNEVFELLTRRFAEENGWHFDATKNLDLPQINNK